MSSLSSAAENRIDADRHHTAVEWRVADGSVDYEDAVSTMEQRVADIRAGTASELVWLVEHPPLYTAGTSASSDELLVKDRFPVYSTGRGGKHTYHGPGQRVAYAMLDLQQRRPDVRGYVRNLERWVIETLSHFGVSGEARPDRIGIWVPDNKGGEAKIAAIGVRIRKWVTYHGIALNVEPDLSHFEGIVPCGISDYGVTSLNALGVDATMADVDIALRDSFSRVFG